MNLKGGIFVRDWWQPYEIPLDGPRKGKFPDLDFVIVSVDPAFSEKVASKILAPTWPLRSSKRGRQPRQPHQSSWDVERVRSRVKAGLFREARSRSN